jgi:ATP-binding cassette subfamily F protein uup
MAEGDGRWTEYAGGYSDMVAQRGEGVEARKPKAEPVRSSTPPRAEAPAPPRKLSFKEKHALETLPSTMKKLEAEIAALEAKLADASLFTRDPKSFEHSASRLTAARQDLASAEEQWLELEMKREMLEG